MKAKIFDNLLALAVIAITAIPVGAAVFILGFLRGDSPCVLCWEQRIGMIIVALIGLFILRYGPRPKYLGLLVLVGAFGVYMGLRHSAMHAARDIGQGFSVEILGAHTYVWSMVVFWLCLVAAGIALLVVREGDDRGAARQPGFLGKTAMVVFLVVTAANAFQAVTSTGPPPFLGQGDPVRYSFNPRHWVWSIEEWSSIPISWRGRWDVDKPSLDGLDADPSRGPLAGLEILAAKRQEAVTAVIGGEASDIACNPAGDTFLLTTTDGGIALVDGELKRVLRHAVIDTGYSVDLGHLVGAAWEGDQTFTALAWNKSFVTLRVNDHADARKNFRYFREGAGRFDEIQRGRFTTVRARMMYVMGLAYDPQGASFFTVTVPNRRNRRLVISRFDQGGMGLAEEYLPDLAPSASLAFSGQQRALGEYYVTGLAIKDRLMYAVSASYSTLLVIDLDRRALAAARAVPGLSRPCGLAIRGGELYFLNQGNRILVTDIPSVR